MKPAAAVTGLSVDASALGAPFDAAPLSYWLDLARRHCRTGEQGTTCAWYHGFWPFLRSLGLAASPDRHRRFFLGALGARAEAGDARVMVSGAADHSMLAHVLEAWTGVATRSAPAPVRRFPPDVTVVDVCPTPLVHCARYARGVGDRVATVAADVTELATGEPVDVACTHSFLSQFAPADRSRLVGAWHGLLRPGGRVVTTARISPPGTPDRVSFSPLQAAAFERVVVERAARAAHGASGEDLGELAAAARAYAGQLAVYPTLSTGEVRRLFEEGGFDIEHLEEVSMEGVLQGPAGPATHQAGTHVEIVARRG